MAKYKTTYSKSYALIVGIDEYEHLTPLMTAVRGGNALADLLQNKYGFETKTLFNDHVTQENILGWFNSLNCGPDDRVLFYFAGHGLTRPTPTHNIGYLAVAKTMPGEYHTALKTESVIEEAQILEAKHVLILIDACFSGLALTRSSYNEDFSIQKVSDTLISRSVRYVITAGGAEVVDDNAGPGGQYSIFTHYLLRGLRGDIAPNEGMIRARKLANYLEERVSGSRKSRHKPNHGYLEGSEDGDFVFTTPEHLLQSEDTSRLCLVHDPSKIFDGEDHKISLLGRFQKITDLTVLEKITIGQSGSGVYLVDVHGKSFANLDGLFFCKIYRTPTGEEKEIYQKVLNTNLSEHIPQLVDNTPLTEGWMASLYEPAYNTTLRGSQSLSNLLRKNMKAAHDGILGLVDLLYSWNAPYIDRKNSDAFNLLRYPLQRFVDGSSSVDKLDIASRVESFIRGLDSTVLELQYSKQSLPNPTAYISRRDLWQKTRTLVWPVGHVHGDLHSNNVIFQMDHHNNTVYGNPVLIDFDTYQSDSCIFFDLAYLEIDIARLMLDPAHPTNREMWTRVSHYLVQNLQIEQHPPLGPQAFALINLLTPIRSTVAKICEKHPGDFEIAYWLARTAAGLNIARKRKINSVHRKLALLIAADSLDKALEELDIEHHSEQQPYWMNWFGEKEEDTII